MDSNVMIMVMMAMITERLYLELIASVEAPACQTSISASVIFLNVC